MDKICHKVCASPLQIGDSQVVCTVRHFGAVCNDAPQKLIKAYSMLFKLENKIPQQVSKKAESPQMIEKAAQCRLNQGGPSANG